MQESGCISVLGGISVYRKPDYSVQGVKEKYSNGNTYILFQNYPPRSHTHTSFESIRMTVRIQNVRRRPQSVSKSY